MGWFKRKGSDVIDLSNMQKRGLLPESVPEKNEEGVVDFSSSSEVSPSASSSSGDLDFLSGLAGASASTQTNVQSSPGPVTSSLRMSRQKHQLEAQVNEMKLKMDDNEYRIGQLNEKIKELELKLRELKG